MFPEHLRYSKEHVWLRDDGSEFVVGVTEHAVELLGQVSRVELPVTGIQARRGEEVAFVESVDAANEIFAPVSGRIVAVNGAIEDAPELVSRDPYGQGWFFKMQNVKAADVDLLVDAETYKRHVAEYGD